MKYINNMMQKNSPYIKLYKQMDEMITTDNTENLRMFFSRDINPMQNPYVYNLPSHQGNSDIPEDQGVISACFLRGNDDLPPKNTFIIYPRHKYENKQSILYNDNKECEPMCYPLLFPYGDAGIYIIKHFNLFKK